ncbi:hypothetical protein VNO77_47277 [Canavalia gladiata]|uniref:Uncharacterized protein n=1 Tax=Canavalia gladiata TaxID=3824 RepID=A0AAN9JFE6_CANGL
MWAADCNVRESGDVGGGPRKELSFLFNSLPTLETAQPEVGSSGWKSTARRVVSASGRWNNVGKGSRQNGSVNLVKRIGSEGWARGSQSRTPSAVRWTARAAPRGESGSPRAGRGRRIGNGHLRVSSPGVEQSTQNCALNVKVKKFNQARVNGGSNYDSLRVAKCLVI